MNSGCISEGATKGSFTRYASRPLNSLRASAKISALFLRHTAMSTEGLCLSVPQEGGVMKGVSLCLLLLFVIQ
jgi:hypothetical protein